MTFEDEALCKHGSVVCEVCARAEGAASERDSIRSRLLQALDARFQASIAAEAKAPSSIKRHGERRIRHALALVRIDVDRICQEIGDQ